MFLQILDNALDVRQIVFLVLARQRDVCILGLKVFLDLLIVVQLGLQLGRSHLRNTAESHLLSAQGFSVATAVAAGPT